MRGDASGFEEQKHNYKRKKRRSFVQCVKKKFKYGESNNNRRRGTNLDQDIHEYFLRVFEQSRQEFKDAEEKGIFVENVFGQILGHEVEYSKHQLVSRIVEDLLPYAGENVFAAFLDTFSSDSLRSVCVHPFASHVLETLVRLSARRVLLGEQQPDSGGEPKEKRKRKNDEDEVEVKPENGATISEDQKSRCYVFVLKVARFLSNNLDEFLGDSYANHVLRTAVTCLAGDLSAAEKGENRARTRNHPLIDVGNKSDGGTVETPAEFVSTVEELGAKFLCLPSFADSPRDALMSGVLQTVLRSLKAVGTKKEIKRMVGRLLDEAFAPSEDGGAGALDSQEAVRLMEAMLDVSAGKLYENIYCRCFAGRLASLAVGRASNYAVQRLIRRCQDAAEFSGMYAELSRGGYGFREIITSGSPGVILAICKTCHRLGTKQGALVKDIAAALGVGKDSDGNLALRLLTLSTPSVEDPKGKMADGGGDDPGKPKVDLHGCLIVQEILSFESHNKRMVKSVLSIDGERLAAIVCDPKGSHIADAFFAADGLRKKDRRRFVEKLKGSFAVLACSKHGSFAITAIWRRSDIEAKSAIVRELSERESLVLSSPSGRLVARQVALNTYRHQPEAWESAQANAVSTKAMFNEIFEKDGDKKQQTRMKKKAQDII